MIADTRRRAGNGSAKPGSPTTATSVRSKGARCTGYATTVHHLIPSSQAPHLFWEPSNLVAACRRCNHGDGSRIAAESTRQTIERFRALVEEQEQQIAQMAERLARREDQAVKRRVPAIY
ncbi:MAG TPA: HNH endonuclease [Gaiellaceae bacterium]|nr:HNH endonuclease [Gaiellaceae bacterium]